MMTANRLPVTQLSHDDCLLLADVLPDSPETVITTSQLRRGLAKAWVVGEAAGFETAVVEDTGQPGEPIVFGEDVTQIAAVLPHIPNWDCANVPFHLAGQLAPLLERKMGCPLRHLADVYHTLNQPVPQLSHPQVRLLTPEDMPLLAAASFELQGPHPQRTLLEMKIAAAVVNGQLAAIAQNYARSSLYGEIGVHTLPDFRERGLASAAAAQIAYYIQSLGLTPVWSCGEHNEASLRVAHKLGFREVSRRTYLILDR
ncbi:MAG: GNAT family N-acetyltransferase [Chloroflexi bacterium]|nr:GNAT family N-acetyltransferase [Chloroflexota bacterium]